MRIFPFLCSLCLHKQRTVTVSGHRNTAVLVNGYDTITIAMREAISVVASELSKLQLSMLQRTDSPSAIFQKAVKILKHHKEDLVMTEGSISSVPMLLRSCATVFAKAPAIDQQLLGLEALDTVFPIAKEYVGTQCGNVNEASSVLRSITSMDETQRRSSPDDVTFPPSAEMASRRYSLLLRPSYAHAYHQWSLQSTTVHTMSVLALLRGTAAVHGSAFSFSSSKPDARSLLPIKDRVQMEAKMQRCQGSRELMNALKEMTLSRLDAGMGLLLMAELGFYDMDLCNMLCEVLHSSHSAVTSQQFSQIVYSLGVLQHRHVYQRYFSSLLQPKDCNADGIRQHVLGLAMLQQPPHSEKSLMNGIFLHALRGSKAKVGTGSPYALPLSWYVDVGYALSTLGITHHKYKIMTARQAMGGMSSLSTNEQCKLLYALGPINDPSVPEELQQNWRQRVEKSLSVVIKKLEKINTVDGPQVMHALRCCGVTQHPRIPQHRETAGGQKENPVEVLLRTWAQTSNEVIIGLVEQIDHHHLQGATQEGRAEQLVKVVSTLAKACPSLSPQEFYRFAAVCNAVERTASHFTVRESITVLHGMTQMGLHEHYEDTVKQLLDGLWEKRLEMTSEESVACAAIMVRSGDTERAAFFSAH